MTTDMTLDASGIAEIIQLARDAAGVFRPSVVQLEEPVTGLPKDIWVLFRDGDKPDVRGIKDLFEPYRTAPERRTGTAIVTTLASFIDLVNRHKDDNSAIFAETAWPNPSLTAVIDYHTTGETKAARFAGHRITYPFPLTDEFKAWIGGNGKPMAQGDFASFVEDRVADLAAPFDAEAIEFERLFKVKFATPADMIDLSRGLQVHVAATVKNAAMMQTGEVEMVFREEHQNAAGEKIVVPGVFMVSTPAFIDGDPVRLPARLRYRLRDGKVVWSYHLYRWEYWLRLQVTADLDEARTKTALPTFEGRPEK